VGVRQKDFDYLQHYHPPKLGSSVTYRIDIEACSGCGGEGKIIASIWFLDMSAAMTATGSGHHSNSNTIRELNPLLVS
jgi:hypothetical protein